MAGLPDNNNPINLIQDDTDMPDDRTVRQAMAEMGISVEDIAARCGVDASHVGKQLRGQRPLHEAVKAAFVEALDARAIAALPHVARLLMDHDEPDAADACERIWERLQRADGPPSG